MFFKNIALKHKLNLSFFIVTCVSIFITTISSIFYFSGTIKNDATENIRNNMKVANLIYDSKMTDVNTFTNQLANDNSVQTFLNNQLDVILKSYLTKILLREKIYHICVYNANGELINALGLSNSLIIKHSDKINLNKNKLVRLALNGQNTVTNELIPISGEENILAISASSSVIKDDKIIGVILVRYVLNNNKSLIQTMQNVMAVNPVIYQNFLPISYINKIDIDKNNYNQLMSGKETVEDINIYPGGRLTELQVIKDFDNNPIGVLGISVSADKYINDLINAIILFIIIMIICIIGANILGYFVSNTILVPIRQLLNGVNKITSGDLSYEIMIDLKDEIGRLSDSFNEMRLSLNDKIGTIEQMNKNLENTVKERTNALQNVLNKMKKYLSPQLYDSIIGGTRDENISHQRKKLTVFFSDIKDFTKTTDSMEAEELSELLNNYLDEMAKIALKWGGTIDKFIGDAVMIFFGDPEFINDKEHALRAVKMAIEMRERLGQLRYEWSEKGISKPLHIRIGINTGFCTVGNFGSENRMDYTIIGSQVNITQRLEAAAEIDQILISHETFGFIHEEIDCVFVGEITVKGIHYPIKTYKVLSEKKKSEDFEKYIKKTKDGVFLKNLLIDPENIDNNERENIAKALKVALYYLNKKS